ncbi:dTMP kinase [Plantactinospora sp. B6F1]|uniref:dTMP kinase n=1 Tax=Plantactinospora sp. B6F1 TaxID=3158971 RepID=UPI00102B7589
MTWPLAAIEAVSGAGKTTVRKHLFHALAQRGQPPLTVNQISWLVPAQARVLTRAYYQGLPTRAEEILDAYLSDKQTLADRLINPHRAERVVVADRYVASDLAYQEAIWGLTPELVYPRYRAADVPLPDVVVYLDRPRDAVLERLRGKKPEERAWWESEETVGRLYDSFQRVLALLATDGVEVITLDAMQGADALREAIDASVVPNLLGQRTGRA